jgi:predicted ester cyclase
MTPEENKAIVRRFIEEIINTGDTTKIGEIISPLCIETDGIRRVKSGIDGMKAHVEGVRSVYPDLHVSIEQQIAEGDWVSTRIIARGTHSGSWLGMKPTGKNLTFTGVNLNKIADGRIIEHGGAANMLHPFLDAGALSVVGEDTP